MAKVIIFSAPSGSGKSTLINHLMKHVENLHFSISATSRPPRGKEQNGVEYFFLSEDEFRTRRDNGEFLEWCEVYEGRFYGTLKTEVDHMLARGENVVCDVDVIGGMNIKQVYGEQVYGEQSLSVFIQPPSIEALRQRLISRATDAPEVIEQRVERAAYEMTFAEKYDTIVVNDDLATAQEEIVRVVRLFLEKV